MIRKIAQNHSLRNFNNTDYNEFYKKNMSLYVRKKTAYLRSKVGKHLSYD